MSGSDPADSGGDDDPDRPESADENETPDETRGGDQPTQSDSDATTRATESDSDDVTAEPPAATDRDTASDRNGVTIENDGIVRWFLKTEDGTIVFVRDVLSSVAIVAVIGLLLFAVSGVWPPLVAVESGSMEPNMERGDLIFVVADDRFVGDDSIGDTGVVPAQDAQESGYETFGEPGDVIIFKPDGSDFETPIIHRAHFWVEEGENWVDTRANEEYVNGASCDEVTTCPAAHDGFITKGDNEATNPTYDQFARGGNPQSDVVRPDWITGKAQYRIPYLGHVRLTFDSILGSTHQPTIDSTQPATTDPLQTTSTPIEAYTGGAVVTATGVGAAVAITRRRV